MGMHDHGHELHVSLLWDPLLQGVSPWRVPGRDEGTGHMPHVQSAELPGSTGRIRPWTRVSERRGQKAREIRQEIGQKGQEVWEEEGQEIREERKEIWEEEEKEVERTFLCLIGLT